MWKLHSCNALHEEGEGQLVRLIKSNIPTDRKNSFFIKVLSGILVFCLLLVSFVFLLIYQNVKKRSLEQSYLAEQDIVSNVSYSASIMQDTASSMLTQLNGDPKLLQLIYSMDTESLSVIQSMQLLQNYTRASSWLDSVYIYCAEEDCICYAYANGNTYQLSFGTLDDFFDAAFVRNLAAVSRVTQKPAMRQLRYRSTSSDKTVFSYVLPVRTSLNRYNGFFVANISAERLMQLGYGMANGTERQLLIVDANGQTYTSGMTLLEQEQTDAVIEAVLGGAAESGQMVVQEANAICTWSRSADTDLYFISCISDSAISSQLRALTRWFLLFYLGIVVFAVLISVYLTIRINREYAALQTQYTLSEKRYAENYSYIKHAILRSFFTLRSSDFVIGRQFSDNGIELEQYSGFALFLLQLRQRAVLAAAPTAQPRAQLRIGLGVGAGLLAGGHDGGDAPLKLGRAGHDETALPDERAALEHLRRHARELLARVRRRQPRHRDVRARVHRRKGAHRRALRLRPAADRDALAAVSYTHLTLPTT